MTIMMKDTVIDVPAHEESIPDSFLKKGHRNLDETNSRLNRISRFAQI